MVNDYRHSQTERRSDDWEAQNRVRGPNRDTSRDASRNGPSSATLASKPLAERSRSWENSNNHGAAHGRDRPLSPRDSTLAPKTDLFPERLASKSAPDAKSAPRTATAAMPDVADVQAKLREMHEIDTDLRELKAKRAKVNRERATARLGLSKLSRTRTDHLPSTLNHLKSQQKKFEEELTSLDGQIGDKEARHLSVFQQLFQPYIVPGTSSGKGSPSHDCHAGEAALVAKTASEEASFKKTLLDHKSAIEQHLSSTLDQYKSQMESLACRAQRDMHAMADKYETRISELTLSLEKESKRNSLLQNQLLAHEHKLQELDLARSQPSRNCVLAESIENNLSRLQDSQAESDSRTGALDARMNDLDLAVSQLRQTTCVELESFRKKTAEDVRKLTRELASSRTEISSLPLDELKSLPFEFTNLQKSVRDRLDHQTGQVPPLSSSRSAQLQSPTGSSRANPDSALLIEKRVHEGLAELERSKKRFDESLAGLETAKQDLTRRVQIIGPWVDGERAQRTQMGIDLEKQLSDLHANVEGTKAEQARITEGLGNLKPQVDNLSKLGGTLESVDERLKDLYFEFKGESCMIHAQLQSLASWQEHFNTKSLYRDIVTHINSVTSEGVPKSIANLNSRLSNIERQFQSFPEMVKRRRDSVDEDPSKRRRIGDNSTILLPA